MGRWLTRHRSVVGYVFLVVVTALVLEWHHVVTTNDIRRLQHRACTRSTVLADNQKVVIATLIAMLRYENRESIGPPGYLSGQLEQLSARLDNVPAFDC